MTPGQRLEAAFGSSLRHGLVLLFFVLLPLATTWPLAAHLGTHVPGESAGDNLSTLWSFWWMRQALSSSDLDFWRTTFLFHPGGADLVQHTHTALNAWIGATLLGGLSEITALNVVLLGALTLAGFGTYLLAWDLTGHRGASIVAGVFFCAAPFFPARLLGHFNFVSAWGLPFFAWLWLRALGAPPAVAMRPAMMRSVAWAAAAGLVLAAVAYTDYYYVAYLLLFIVCVLTLRHARIRWERPAAPIAWTWIDSTLVACLAAAVIIHTAIVITGGFTWHVGGARISMRNGLNVRTAAWVFALIAAWRRIPLRPRIGRAERAERSARASTPADAAKDDGRSHDLPLIARLRPGGLVRDAALLAVTLIVFTLAASPLIARAVDVWQRGGYVELDKRWHSAPIGIDPLAMLFGNPFHPLYGAASRALYALASTARLEFVAWFGVVPLVILIAWRRHWLAPGASGRADARLWIAIGAVFGVWAVGPYLRVAGIHTGLWLPASLVQYVPILSNARLPSRAIVMVYLSLAALIALAIAARARVTEPGPLGARMIAAIGALILFDFAAQPIARYRIDRPVLFQQLAALPFGAVCVLPLGLRDGIGETGRFEHRSLAHQLTHGKPILGGFVARLPKAVIERHAESPVIGSLLRLSSGGTLDDAALARDRAAIARTGVPFRYVVIHVDDAAPRLRDYVTSMLSVRMIASENGAAGERVELYELTGGAAR